MIYRYFRMKFLSPRAVWEDPTAKLLYPGCLEISNPDGLFPNLGESTNSFRHICNEPRVSYSLEEINEQIEEPLEPRSPINFFAN